MKRSGSETRKSIDEDCLTSRQRSVKWDEANLEENEKIQIELNPRKINEPKTPYHGPLDSDDEAGEASMAPLSLEDEVSLLAEERNQGTSTSSGREEDRNSLHHGWSDSERSSREYSGPLTNSHSQSSSATQNPGDECDSNPAAREKLLEKRRKFEARRRKHYNMREALRRGKELLSHDLEDRKEINRLPAQNGFLSPANDIDEACEDGKTKGLE